MKRIIAILLILCSFIIIITSCSDVSGSREDALKTKEIASVLQTNQPTPSDISYSLERYNLIRRAYWVNGQREKANMLPCEIEKPFGYVILFSNNVVVGNFIVDGKVSSLNSFLTPDSEYYEGVKSNGKNDWLADIDGSYGANDGGIFFFTPDGKYIEWSGDYLYSDIPFVVDSPILNIKEGN